MKAEGLPERFLTKFIPRESGCWEWTAYKQPGGYGVFVVGGGQVVAHRFAYELLVGSVPEGLELDHLCRNPSCVNPEHLEPVTHKENMRRGQSFVAINAAKTHCPAGHSYEGAPVDKTGGRLCRPCINARKRAKRREGRPS